MEFYIVKDEKTSFDNRGYVASYFSRSRIVSEPDYTILGGDCSRTRFFKIWKTIIDKIGSDSVDDLFVEADFAYCTQYSIKYFGSDNGENMLLCGVRSCKLTHALLDTFGENEVKIQVQIYLLRQRRRLCGVQLTSPEMLVKRSSNTKCDLACTSWGPFSWFEEVENYCPFAPNGSLDIKIVVSPDGVRNAEKAGFFDIDSC